MISSAVPNAKKFFSIYEISVLPRWQTSFISQMLPFPVVVNPFSVSKKCTQRIQNTKNETEELKRILYLSLYSKKTDRRKCPFEDESATIVNYAVTANVVAIV